MSRTERDQNHEERDFGATITFGQALRRLGVSAPTLLRMVESGEILSRQKDRQPEDQVTPELLLSSLDVEDAAIRRKRPAAFAEPKRRQSLVITQRVTAWNNKVGVRPGERVVFDDIIPTRTPGALAARARVQKEFVARVKAASPGKPTWSAVSVREGRGRHHAASPSSPMLPPVRPADFLPGHQAIMLRAASDGGSSASVIHQLSAGGRVGPGAGRSTDREGATGPSAFRRQRCQGRGASPTSSRPVPLPVSASRFQG